MVMGRQPKRDPLPDAVFVSSKVTWAPPVEVGMACRAMAHGFRVAGRIVEVLDPKAGEVMVLADDGQDCTATTGEDGQSEPVTWTLFTPGQPFAASWQIGLESVQRSDGRWERPVLEVIREKHKAALGWQLSDAVRCDPHYRNRITGGGIRGKGGRFQGRGEGGGSVARMRWSTTLRPDALEVLRELAAELGVDRNEVVERLLLNQLVSPSPGSESAPGNASDLEHLWDPAAQPMFTVKPPDWIATYLPRYCQSAADRADSDCRGLALMVRELQRDAFWQQLFPDWETCCQSLFKRPAAWVEQVIESVRVLHGQDQRSKAAES